MPGLEKKAALLLIRQKKTLALAESCSGGLLSHRLTNIPGSSAFLKLGLVVYSNDVKRKLLKVPGSILTKYGAVSHPVALLLAKNVRKIHKTDFGLSITGIAGPSGGTKSKPVGLTFIGFSSARKTVHLKFIFKGNRQAVKKQATTAALKLLLQNIS